MGAQGHYEGRSEGYLEGDVTQYSEVIEPIPLMEFKINEPRGNKKLFKSFYFCQIRQRHPSARHLPCYGFYRHMKIVFDLRRMQELTNELIMLAVISEIDANIARSGVVDDVYEIHSHESYRDPPFDYNRTVTCGKKKILKEMLQNHFEWMKKLGTETELNLFF